MSGNVLQQLRMFGEQCLAMLGAEKSGVVGLGRLLGAGLLEQKETAGQESVRRRWGGSTAGYAGDGGINLDLWGWPWACPPEPGQKGTPTRLYS